MDIKTTGKRIALLLTMLVLLTSFPVTAYALDQIDNSTNSNVSNSKEMTSGDWAELQSEAQAEISRQQNSENNKPGENNEEPKGGSFKDFKNGSYVGSGEWLLIIGIILIVLGAAGIGFIVFMMIRRMKLSKSKSNKMKTVAPTRREKLSESTNTSQSLFVESNDLGNSYTRRGSSGRRIAPKNDK